MIEIRINMRIESKKVDIGNIEIEEKLKERRRK